MIKARKNIFLNHLYWLFIIHSAIFISYTVFLLGQVRWNRVKLLIHAQNKLVRIITSSVYRTGIDSLYHNIKVLKVPEIYDYAICLFMFKLYHGLMPSIFQCMLAVNSATHDYGTRQGDHYKVPKVKLDDVKNSVRYRGVIIWNMNLRNIDITTSLQSSLNNDSTSIPPNQPHTC